MRPGESCRTCVYVMDRNDDFECHRHAPVPIPDGADDRVWPRVYPDATPGDWCGEYVKAPEPEAP